MLLSWTHFLPTASLSSSSSYVFSVSGMFYDICFLWGLRVQITIRKNTQRDTLRMQNWPDVCVCVCVCARAHVCVRACARACCVQNFLRDLKGPRQFPARCFCYLAVLIRFSPALLYFSPFVFLHNSFCFRLCLPCMPPLRPHNLLPYFTMWKVTQSFPSRVCADRKSIFNEVTLLLKCF